MENDVVETNVAPVSEVVEATAQAVQAIQPVAVPQIVVPTNNGILGKFNGKDALVAGSLFGGGVATAIVVPWIVKKIKKGIDDVKTILSYRKETAVANQNPVPSSDQPNPVTEAQSSNVNPATPQA